MSKPPHSDLSRRERQIMDVIHRRGKATVGEIQEEIGEDATYSAIRSALRLLGQKEVIRHEHDGKKYVYMPAMSANEAQRSALDHLMETFFEGSQASTVSAILEMADRDLPEDELERLEALVRSARERSED